MQNSLKWYTTNVYAKYFAYIPYSSYTLLVVYVVKSKLLLAKRQYVLQLKYMFSVNLSFFACTANKTHETATVKFS